MKNLDELLIDVRESAEMNDWCINCGRALADDATEPCRGCVDLGYSNRAPLSVRAILERLDDDARTIEQLTRSVNTVKDAEIAALRAALDPGAVHGRDHGRRTVSGPVELSLADYDEAILNLTEARNQIARGWQDRGCGYCGSEEHQPNACRFNPLVVAHPSQRPEIWRCYHCCATFAADELPAARAHFGLTYTELPTCVREALERAGVSIELTTDENGSSAFALRLALRPQADDESRCAVCGWALVTDATFGCVRGNCSMRPRPARLYAPERVEREAILALRDLAQRVLDAEVAG